MFEKINQFLLRKLSKSKCQYLFAVPKRTLFDRIHELSEKVTELEFRNEVLRETITKADNQNNALKTQIETHTSFDYERAYKGLAKDFEEYRKRIGVLKRNLN